MALGGCEFLIAADWLGFLRNFSLGDVWLYLISDQFGGKSRVIAWGYLPTPVGVPFNHFSWSKRKEIVPWYSMVRDSLEGFQKAGVFRALKFTKRSKCGVPVTEGCGVNVQRQVSTAGLRLLFLGPACKVGLCWHLGSCILGRFSPFPH